MKEYLEVIKYAYLRTPKFKWLYHNANRGSFTNSGEYTNLKRCLRAYLANNPSKVEIPVRLVVIEGWDENNKPVEVVSESYLAKMI